MHAQVSPVLMNHRAAERAVLRTVPGGVDIKGRVEGGFTRHLMVYTWRENCPRTAAALNLYMRKRHAKLINARLTALVLIIGADKPYESLVTELVLYAGPRK